MSEDPISASLAAAGTALMPMLTGAGAGLAEGAGGFLSSMLPTAATSALTSAAPSVASLLSPASQWALPTGASLLAPTAEMTPGLASATPWASGASPLFKLGSTAGSGLFNMGQKMMPNLALGAIDRAMSPSPSTAMSFSAPDVPPQPSSSGRGSIAPQITDEMALSMLLNGLNLGSFGGRQANNYRQ